jgi:hypothetical protein
MIPALISVMMQACHWIAHRGLVRCKMDRLSTIPDSLLLSMNQSKS